MLSIRTKALFVSFAASFLVMLLCTVPSYAAESTNVASGKTATASSSIGTGTLSMVTDGDKTNYMSPIGTGAQWIIIDLQQSYNINKINLWHYITGGRTFHDVIVQVSNSANFSSGVTTVFNNDTDNSTGQGTGTHAEYAETSGGKTITFSTVNARYVKFWANGSTANAWSYYIEAEVWTEPTPTNVASGKTATASSSIGTGTLSMVTDGDKTNYMSPIGTGAQWIIIDLQQSYNINKINLWHYITGGRTFHDVIVQVSNSANFSSGVTTVFNNDTDNSTGQGTGTHAEYAETSGGKTITFSTVNARYVKFWANGSTANAWSYYIEAEVWTAVSDLKFSSGFEGNVTVTPVNNGVWEYEIEGLDSSTGYSWPMNWWDPKTNPINVLQTIINSSYTLTDYVESRIDTVTGHTGSSTKALFQSVKQNIGSTQNPLKYDNRDAVTGVAGTSDLTDYYTSWWMKLGEDAVGILDQQQWRYRILFEYKTRGYVSPYPNTDDRISFGLYNISGTTKWHVELDHCPSCTDYWVADSDVNLPEANTWFKVEIYWHRSKGTDGRFYIAIDGTPIIDRHGYTQASTTTSPIGFILGPTVYGGPYGTPWTQWIDDLEIWDGFPDGTS